MTREAQIRQTAADWLRYYHPTCTQDMLVEAFRCGAQWADENPKSPWISVEERLPEDDVEVIGITERGWVFLIWRNENEWYGEEYRDLLWPDITHWMPIPELKKGE